MALRLVLHLFTLLVIITITFTPVQLQIVSDAGENMSPPAQPAPAPVDPSTDTSGMDAIPQGPGFTPDITPFNPNAGGRPAKPRFDRFNRWMKVLQEFFTKGNWFNGGPDNLLEFIGRTLTKLMDILMNRDVDDVTTAEIFGDNAAAARTAIQTNRNQLTVADILKMIPQDRLNVPADRLFN